MVFNQPYVVLLFLSRAGVEQTLCETVNHRRLRTIKPNYNAMLRSRSSMIEKLRCVCVHYDTDVSL